MHLRTTYRLKYFRLKIIFYSPKYKNIIKKIHNLR